MGSEGLLFTSESVTCGHPDKLCDAISDAIVDACLKVDPNARVAVETLVKTVDGTGHIVLAGEVQLDGDVPDYESIARKTAGLIGYTDHNIGLNATSHSLCEVQQFITTQAPDIAKGVDRDGAGDQGLMFGYACTETEYFDDLKDRYFPLAAALSQRLTRRLKNVRELPSGAEGHLSWVRPDGKSQVTVEYDESGKPSRVHTVIIAIQHDNRLKDRFGGDEVEELNFVESQITKHVIEHALPSSLLDENTKIIVNGTGRFADPGGPQTDAGLTGRKVIVDTYGGMGRHGGGAFSGKDPSKVDRSGAYAARWAAKHVVAAGLAERCEIQLAYVIGVAEPVSIRIDTFGTSTISESEISRRVKQTFDFTPQAIINSLDLLKPIYSPTASGGHFGRTPGVDGLFPWELLKQDILSALIEN
ncbi:MAG: methionine adenosyltransferase [Methanobacteriota archaeon]|jgi:S-adenosylmethionine synthetase|nr:MAG: methionine adenosyltransferase [Euryarchaeota archaeon]HIG20038.1 methionine adenosyltransferase [Candidatus Poseidoniales archaeon]